MSNITAEMVKRLRVATGAGMMACKKALEEVQGDFDKAVDHLRKAGQAKAAKRSDKVAAEGQVVTAVSTDKTTGCLVEINSETDFVARDQSFQAFAEGAVAAILAGGESTFDAAMALPYDSGSDQTIAAKCTELAVKLGENIHIRRLELVTVPAGGLVACYSHGGRIGVLVALDAENSDLAKDIAMHIAAFQPEAISAEEVPPELLEREKAVFAGQAENSGKPAEILEKIVAGRIQKFLKEVTLLEQPFLKDTDKTVGQVLESAGVHVTRFVRYEVGEGIDKQEQSFSEEVMAQVQGQDK